MLQLYLATYRRFHNYSFTQLSLGSLAATTETLKWSHSPSWLWELKRVHYNPKRSQFTATDHLLGKPWEAKSTYLGSRKLFTAVSCLISSCPFSYRRRVCRKDKTASVALKEAYRVGQGTSYASMTWSPSVHLLLPRQGTFTYSQPWSHGEHLTGFEETSWWDPSSTLLIWLYVLSISHSLLLQNHRNPWILCIYILYYTSSRSSNLLCRFFKFFWHQLQDSKWKGWGGHTTL